MTWPLFLASQRGHTALAQVLLKYKPNLAQQNQKGTSALWIAACNRHVDVVADLLQAGADPNQANHKGDTPLIPACHKGSEIIVGMLLDAGAKLTLYNKNRDHAAMICCRIGQAKILEILLARLPADEAKALLAQCAHIDGFNPLLAATEVEKVECVRVCLKYVSRFGLFFV